MMRLAVRCLVMFLTVDTSQLTGHRGGTQPSDKQAHDAWSVSSSHYQWADGVISWSNQCSGTYVSKDAICSNLPMVKYSLLL